MIKLRPYQQEITDAISASSSKKNFVQAATGFGKTIVFSHLANNYPGRVLILVNRTELIEQTSRNITRQISLITSKTKKIGKGEVVIGMVESFHNRQKKGGININQFDLVIIDEAHNLQFTKVIESYENRLLAFSATPVTLKRETYFKCRYCEKKTDTKEECCGKENQKYTLNVSLKRYYGDLIQGIEIEKLIELGNLTDVHNFVCNNSNLDKLKTDSSGEYTNKSIDETFNNLASTENLIENYKIHCSGKKTMVFNANIEANNEAYKLFLQSGFNVRSYDSKSKTKRKEVVDWFKNTPDAVLMSVGVFTVGFDCEDVECIIMNKATKSLSLYHQIVGRGGRITNKIFKPYFKLIDLGGNIDEHGSWNASVNWETIYNNEKEKKSVNRDLEDFKICYNCEAMITEYDCEFCGAEKKEKKKKNKVVIAQELKKLPPPKAAHVINYALANDLDVNDAKKIVANYILDMFIFSNTKRDSIKENIDYLKAEIKKTILPIYFAIHKSDLKGNRKRTIKDFEFKVFNKLNKHYENRS